MINWKRAATGAAAALALVALGPAAADAGGKGATQFSGTGFPGPGECDAAADGVEEPDYIIVMTGDLSGCIYGYTDEFQARPSGTYLDVGPEIFVSSENSGDRFFMYQRYTAKFTDDGQKFGRCQHKITGGEGIYEGVTGRVNFKDTIVDGVAVCYEYRGHMTLD